MEQKSFKIINGNKKILLSAPHSVLHQRENNIRSSETRTGDIVKRVARESKSFGIYKIKPEFNDANWDKHCNYKTKVKEIVNKEKIKALIDFHGMAVHREQDICIGINNGQNIFGYNDIVKEMISIFKKYRFNNVTIDEPFNAKYEYCVSSYIAKECRIPTFQIEINLKYRSSIYNEYEKYNKLISALIEIITLIDNKIN